MEAQTPPTTDNCPLSLSFVESFVHGFNNPLMLRGQESLWQKAKAATNPEQQDALRHHFWGYFLGIQAQERWLQAKEKPLRTFLWAVIFCGCFYQRPLLTLGATALGMGTIITTGPGSALDGQVKELAKQASLFPNEKTPAVLLGAAAVALASQFFIARLIGLHLLTWPLAIASGIITGNWLQTDPQFVGGGGPSKKKKGGSAVGIQYGSFRLAVTPVSPSTAGTASSATGGRCYTQ
jgi:hypothetical protein